MQNFLRQAVVQPLQIIMYTYTYRAWNLAILGRKNAKFSLARRHAIPKTKKKNDKFRLKRA